MLKHIERECNNQNIQSVSLHHRGFLAYDHKGQADWIISRYALHHLPDAWKQVALMRVSEMLGPSGRFFLRDVIFWFSPSDYEAQVSEWIARMSHTSGYNGSDFAMHLRAEYSTYAWIMEGMLERSGFVIESAAYPSTMYAEYVCRTVLVQNG